MHDRDAHSIGMLGLVSRQDFCVATGSGLGLGDQGHDGGSLLRHSPLDTGSQPWTVSRPGVVKAGRPCVSTQQVCCDRVG